MQRDKDERNEEAATSAASLAEDILADREKTSPALAAKQARLLALLRDPDPDPNRPETEEDGSRAGALRIAKVRNQAAASLARSRGRVSQAVRDELAALAGADATLARMLETGRPLTREVYLAMEYPTGLPRPWTAELEAELPKPFQNLASVVR